MRLATTVASVGSDLQEASFVKSFDRSRDYFLQAGHEEGDMAFCVEGLESNVKLLHQILLFQDNVLTAELLDSKEHNEVSVNQWQD